LWTALGGVLRGVLCKSLFLRAWFCFAFLKFFKAAVGVARVLINLGVFSTSFAQLFCFTDQSFAQCWCWEPDDF